jgi:hypothetical protein
LLDDGLLLVEESTELLHLFSFRLDVEIMGLLLHQGMGALLSATLLGLQPLLAPVALEHALLEEGLLGAIFHHFSALALEVG